MADIRQNGNMDKTVVAKYMNECEALNWIAELLEEPIGNLTPETTRKDIAAWDSLKMLTIIEALDEQFGIVISEKEIEGIKKVGDILNILRKNEHLT